MLKITIIVMTMILTRLICEFLKVRTGTINALYSKISLAKCQ
jgi:hypothetical protein